MNEKNKKVRIQFNIDDSLFDKWQTFLENNKTVFNNGHALFRYMLNNIETLTEKNENLISSNAAEVNKLEAENIELKKEIYRLQNQNNENINDQLLEKLEEIKKEIDILEVMNSAQMTNDRTTIYHMAKPKSSSVYLDAKNEVEKLTSSGLNDTTEKYSTRENMFFRD